ncbi:hypothetical protein [Gordonia sp. (in: high G+C Gram-positive bacteria)]|uniref:hypothetical protein n=1 Tax=Gordonia sp. (in: high G+C Gram-positive bacteria) TaxID=84139 RepID=UPI00391BCE12
MTEPTLETRRLRHGCTAVYLPRDPRRVSVERLGATHLFRVLRGALHLVDSGTEAAS